MMPWERQRDWNKMERATQNEAAKAALKACCQILHLQTDVELVSVTENDRFTLKYLQDPLKPDFGKSMIKLERLMRQALGVVVDLRLEPKADKNQGGNRNSKKRAERGINV